MFKGRCRAKRTRKRYYVSKMLKNLNEHRYRITLMRIKLEHEIYARLERRYEFFAKWQHFLIFHQLNSFYLKQKFLTGGRLKLLYDG